MKAGPVFRDAGIVLLISATLGLLYSLTTRTGFFSPHYAAGGVRTDARDTVPSPAMITLREVHRYLEERRAIFLDARHEAEYAQGHIGNALNVPLSDFERHADMLAALPRDTLLVTYCDGGGCNASIELAARLAGLGFRNVKIFYGGWEEWEAARIPAGR
jgi:rhodanese-related sulfurtransferase